MSDDLHQQHTVTVDVTEAVQNGQTLGLYAAVVRPVLVWSDKAERASGDIFLVWMKWAISGDGFARFGVDARTQGNRDFLRYLIKLVGEVLMRGDGAGKIHAMTPRSCTRHL